MHLIRNSRSLLVFLLAGRNWVYVALVIFAAAGVGSIQTRTFLAGWWLATAISMLAGWLLFGVIVAPDEGAVPRVLRRLALCAAPLGLIAAGGMADELLATLGSCRAIGRSLAAGGVVALVTYWALPSLRVQWTLPRRVLDAHATLWVVVAVWAMGYGSATVTAWLNLEHVSPDMAIYEQSIYNTLHGRFLSYTLDCKYPDASVCRLADHCEPIMLLFVPLYALWHSPVWFLLAQVIALASGAIPLWQMGKRWCGFGAGGLAVAVAYLLHPALHAALTDEFHAGVLALPLILWGLHLSLQSRYVGAMAFLVLALACKENVPGTVAAAGVWLWTMGHRRFGPSVVLVAVLWGLIALFVVLPNYSPLGHTPYAGRFGLPSANSGSVSATSRVIWGHYLGYILDMTGPVGLACFAAPLALGISGPELVLHLSTRIRWMTMVALHYHTEILVGIVVGAAAGLGMLTQWASRARFDGDARGPVRGRLVAIGFLVSSIAFVWQGDGVRFWLSGGPWEGLDPRMRGARDLLRLVPADVPALTNSGALATHLARRERLLARITPGEVSAGVLRGYEAVDYVALTVDERTESAAARAAADRYGLELLGVAGDVWLWRVVHPPPGPARAD